MWFEWKKCINNCKCNCDDSTDVLQNVHIIAPRRRDWAHFLVNTCMTLMTCNYPNWSQGLIGGPLWDLGSWPMMPALEAALKESGRSNYWLIDNSSFLVPFYCLVEPGPILPHGMGRSGVFGGGRSTVSSYSFVNLRFYSGFTWPAPVQGDKKCGEAWRTGDRIWGAPLLQDHPSCHLPTLHSLCPVFPHCPLPASIAALPAPTGAAGTDGGVLVLLQQCAHCIKWPPMEHSVSYRQSFCNRWSAFCCHHVLQPASPILNRAEAFFWVETHQLALAPSLFYKMPDFTRDLANRKEAHFLFM